MTQQQNSTMTFRVNLTSASGERLTLIVPGANDRDACERAETRADADAFTGKLAPWAAGFSTRNQ